MGSNSQKDLPLILKRTKSYLENIQPKLTPSCAMRRKLTLPDGRKGALCCLLRRNSGLHPLRDSTNKNSQSKAKPLKRQKTSRKGLMAETQTIKHRVNRSTSFQGQPEDRTQFFKDWSGYKIPKNNQSQEKATIDISSQLEMGTIEGCSNIETKASVTLKMTKTGKAEYIPARVTVRRKEMTSKPSKNDSKAKAKKPVKIGFPRSTCRPKGEGNPRLKTLVTITIKTAIQFII